jgi:uncharacterized membrane protein HdeD (DUF308 family)
MCQLVFRSASHPQFGKLSMTPPKDLGMLLLAIWLILFGLLTSPFLGLSFSHSGDVLGVLAIVTGVLLVMKR